jgi:hypothetical protein
MSRTLRWLPGVAHGIGGARGIPAACASAAGPIQLVEKSQRALGVAARRSHFEAHAGVVIGEFNERSERNPR